MKLFSEDRILQGYHFIKLKTSCPHSFHMNALFELDTIRAVVIICWTSSLVGVVVVVSGFLSAVFDITDKGIDKLIQKNLNILLMCFSIKFEKGKIINSLCRLR